jgi:hypothetical protein
MSTSLRCRNSIIAPLLISNKISKLRKINLKTPPTNFNKNLIFSVTNKN